ACNPCGRIWPSRMPAGSPLVDAFCRGTSRSRWILSVSPWEEQEGRTMSLTSRIIGQLMKLPPAETHKSTVTRDVAVPMPDGVTLLADHYVPRSMRTSYPTLLIRTPYGRRGFFAGAFALPFVERGYQVFVQSCRGTAGSGGDF